MKHVLPVLALIGCAQGDASVVTNARATAPAAAAPRAPAGVPHGGAIRFVAATEQGDAALTVDTLGELRVWPALDGTREPLPVRIEGAAARELALVRIESPGCAGARSDAKRCGESIDSELVGAILDEAGTVSIVRFARDGNMLRRTQLPADVIAQQVVATSDGILVRRSDQTIERYDASGTLRSRVAAPEGERIEMLAARSGAAIAAISEGKDIAKLRWLALGKQLAWGEAIELPQPITRAGMALAPGHGRVAAMLARTSDLGVITLGPKPTIQATGLTATGAVLGFIDDDHAAVGSFSVLWWSAQKQKDPWASASATPAFPTNENAGAIAFCDRVAVGAYAGGLVLEQPTKLRYLGWRDPGVGTMTIAGSLVGFQPNGSRYMWLDSRLAEVRVAELPEFANDLVQMLAVSEHQVVVAHRTPLPAIQVDLYDADRKALVPIGAFPAMNRLEFSPEVGVLTINTNTAVERYSIDLAHSAVTKLEPVPETSSYFVRSVDPARADGAQLIAISNDYAHATVYRANERSKLASELYKLDGAPLAIDPWGRIYTRSNEDGTTLAIERGGRQLFHFKTAAMINQVSVAHDGTSLVYVDGMNVVATDLFGHERWHRAVWGVTIPAYTTDDRHVLVQAAGGMLLLDAETGETAARGCGWSFGLYDQPTAPTVLGSPPVCED